MSKYNSANFGNRDFKAAVKDALRPELSNIEKMLSTVMLELSNLRAENRDLKNQLTMLQSREQRPSMDVVYRNTFDAKQEPLYIDPDDMMNDMITQFDSMDGGKTPSSRRSKNTVRTQMLLLFLQKEF